MENKPSMSRVERLHREKVTRYSIRKYSFGAASVAVAALFMFLGNGAVSANELSKQETSVEATTPTLDKTQLESYISEIETKLSNGSYDNKTEESVAVLKADLEAAKATLANATTQAELKKAYSKLVTTVNAGLRNKPVEKKETPAVDTTEGKETVGKKAENTEPKSESNSIENTGSRDSRNGKEIEKGTGFRTDATAETPSNEITTTAGNISYTIAFSDVATKEIYAYNEEETDISIDVNSTAGKITLAMVRGASGQYLNRRSIYTSPEREELDGFGWTYYSTLEPTEGPIKLRITGKPNDTFKKLRTYTKQENQNAVLGERYLNIVDEADGKIEKGNGSEAYGYFKMVVKSQTYKYQPKELTNTNKVLVANPNQLTPADLESIKNALKIEYSTTNTDARLTSLKGTEVADTNTVVDTVTDSGSNLVVTYKDGSTDTIPKGTLIKSGNAPTVNMPQPASGGPREKSILSTDNTITGTGTPGSKITIQVESAENGKVLKEITDIPVDASGNWTVTLENGLNSNVPVGGNAKAQNFFAPKNPVKVFETKDGIESVSTDTYVSIGASKVLPSEASKDKASVVAGSKEVVLEVPHDAGISYFWYHDKETGKEVQIDIQRDKEVAENLGIKVADKDVDKVAIKSVTKGEFYNTITLEMKKNIKEGVVRIISHNNDGTYSSKAGKVSTPVTNEKPVVASVSGEDTTTVLTNSRLNLLSLVKVTDHEDDQDATLGTKGTPRVVSVDGDTNVTEINTSEVGEHTVVYKTVDSQGKESDEYTHKVIVRENEAPTVELPYSNPDKKQIYVYTGENTDLTFTGKDDITVKNLYLRNKGLDESDNASGYGFTIGKVTDSAVASGEGTVSDDKKTATIKMVGVTNLKAGQKWTSFIEAKDNDGVKSMPANESYSVENYELRRRKPGYVEFIVKSQADKYEIKEPTEKVAVTDPANVTEAELEKIKEKLQIEYSNNNDDANLADKKGKTVDAADAKAKIKSVTKDADGNLVVTYTDDSTDKKPLSEFVTLDKQPAIDAVNNAADEQIKAINANAAATREEKDAAIAKVNADKEKALTAINDANVTTKDALDKAKESGTTAIAADNPVVAKKDAAKADVEAARKAKEDAIKANPNLTQAEKDAAIAKNNTAAAEATKAIDAATTNDAVDQAKTAGTGEIAKVNPVAKDAAKKAVADELAEKEKAIDARTDLTDAEKAAAKEDAKAKAKAATDAINAQPDNAATPEAATTAQTAVNDAKDKGVADVKAVNPVAKEAAKKAIADELAEKEKAIDKRTDLTDEEKAAAKEDAKAKAKAATDTIDAQPSNAATPEAAAEAQTAVNGAKDKGVADVKAVDPVAAKKPAAKKAIDDALTAKNNEIDARTDLTPEEKTKAKEIAKAKADAAKEAVDEATTDAEVDKAKTDGTTAVENVTPVAKEAAKTAIADALTAKNKEIDARTDLTDEEKTAAKKEAKDKADAQLAEIAKQPDAADTPEAAKTAQDAVDAAKKTGVDEVTAVNPAAVKKTEAKQAIDDALTAKNNAIDARTDLTDAEKKVAKDKAAEEAKKAKEAIDAATTDAAVDTAKTAGLDEVAKVNPVAKEVAKKAVADELAKKEAEIDARTDLTQEEKDAAKKDAQDKAKSATDAINEQPDNADTPEKATEAQKAVDTAKKTGVDEVAAVNPEAVTKPAAKKAIDDKLAEQLKAIENTPDATDDEKKVAADAAKTLAEEAKKEIDKAGTDAEVKQLQDEAEKEIEKSVPVVEDKPNARKAIDDEATAKKAAIDARDDLTPKAKEDLKAQVDKIAEQAKKSVDAAKTAESVNGIEESDKAAIKAVGEVNIPADKVLVNDPSALTDDEKAKVLEAVKKVNPDAKEITQDADGNITVTTPDGHQEIITPEQVVKTADTANDPKAGNDVVKPADKVVVNDPAKLTDAEKEKIKAAVETVNPNSVVTVDEKGNAKVSTPDGQTQVIPVEELVRTVEDTKKPNAGNDIVKPADKTVVANPDALTPEEKKAIEDKVKAVNPGSTVAVDDKGNATVTTPEGKTAVIPASDLTKSAADAAKPNAGNDIVKPADKTVVANPDKLTDAEKKAIEDKVKAVNPDATVVVDDKGNATVTTPEGKTAVIPASDLTKSAADAAKPNAGNDIVKPADKTVVANPDALTPEEKKAIEDKVKAVNPGSTVVVDDKGNATVTTPEGKTAVIPATDLTKSAADAAKANAGNAVNTPAAKVEVKDPANLTDAEKKAIENKVKAVNPGSKVVVDDKGNATVTTPEGKTATIPATDLTKSAADAGKENAGNGANTPATKTVVKDPANLTDEEKAKVKKAVEDVNPGSTVVVNDKGDVIVTKGDGTVLVIPELDLVIPEDRLTDPTQQNGVNTPATRVLVGDKAKLTADEIEKVKESIKAVNPGSTVVVDENGNATVTTPEGKTATIPAAQLVKDAKDVAAKNNGENINVDFEKETVADLNNLTDAEKEAAKAKIKGANADVVEVIFDKAGNATVITKDGKVYTIVSKDIFKQRSSTDNGSSANTGQIVSEHTNARKGAKELPYTGTADSTVAMVAAATSALLGLGLAGRRRKEDEEA